MEYFDLLRKLRKILRSINLESKRIEKSFGISIPQLLTLEFLCSFEDYSSTASKIKDHLNLNASTVSGIIHRLEQKGLVIRRSIASDKRSSQVVLTAKGLNLLNDTPKTMQERLTSRLDKLAPQQLSELERNVDLLVELMEIEDLESGSILATQEIESFPK